MRYGRGHQIKPFVIGALLDIVAIPWRYVVANYLLAPGDRWKSVPSRAQAAVEGPPLK